MHDTAMTQLPGSVDLYLDTTVQKTAAELKLQHKVNLKRAENSLKFHPRKGKCETNGVNPSGKRTFDRERNTG